MKQTKTQIQTTAPKAGVCNALRIVPCTKPTVTRPSGGANRRYVASKSTPTNLGMLHQSQALKANAVDPAQDRSETGVGSGSNHKLTGNMVEVSGSVQTPPVTCILTDAKSGRKTSSNRVFVLGKIKKPLMPCTPARARLLLSKGRAVIDRRFPFTIRLKDRKDGTTQPIGLKLDPGAKTTGMALVRIDLQNPTSQHILFTAEISHRGEQIRDSLAQRASFRRSRRARKTRYRAPRFNNRVHSKKEGWLPPSLQHRVNTTSSWVKRSQHLAPVSSIAQELVKFDTQALQNPEISGTQYQQGTLAGYEVREYLLEKWNHRCAYCDTAKGVLNIDHIIAKANGGSDRVSNLTLSCVKHNLEKGSKDIRDYLSDDPKRLDRIFKQAKAPLSAAAAVNATRFALLNTLRRSGLPVTTDTGARTKWNRTQLGLPKSHALDASCVSNVDKLTGTDIVPLNIVCMGRGSHKRTRLTADGFPRGYLSPAKAHFGFRTGDIVKASVPSGKRKGSYFGRVAVRASGSFNIQTASGTVQGINHRHCRLLQSADGYSYSLQSAALPSIP